MPVRLQESVQPRQPVPLCSILGACPAGCVHVRAGLQVRGCRQANSWLMRATVMSCAPGAGIAAGGSSCSDMQLSGSFQMWCSKRSLHAVLQSSCLGNAHSWRRCTASAAAAAVSQHALMYSGFAVGGVVELIGYFTPLPPGTEQGFLSLSFLVETLLMGMHAKPNELDQLVHTLLTWIMIACIVVSAAEIAAPRSLLLALLRAMLVFFQGTWFWHVDSMAWDMNDMGGVMFVPVVFCLHMLLICLGTFSAYLFMRWLYVRLGITSSPTARPAPGAGGKSLPGSHSIVHHDLSPAGHDFPDLDVVLEGQLELTDMYGSCNNGGANEGLDAVAGYMRDGGVRSKRSYAA
ncbi:hypothetical protein COO60DRAFT_459184 [Scenedesmus sp. NREL 46B-D3]|nr:hypothetical protein COO60DRAFT_459184 [Scenedesmus sp. NREL 46B-D3]